jgi:hypothetical protein
MQQIETFYYPLGDRIKKRGADAPKRMCGKRGGRVGDIIS